MENGSMLHKLAAAMLFEKVGFSPASAIGAPGAAGGTMPPPAPAMTSGMAPPAGSPGMAPPPPDPSMGAGMEAAGGEAPVDPATGMPMEAGAPLGGTPTPGGEGGGEPDPMMMPAGEVPVGMLMQIISEVMAGGAEGGGEAGGEAAPAEPAPEPKPEPAAEPEDGFAGVNSRLDQLIGLIGGIGGEMAPAGPGAGAPPPAGVPKMGSVADGIIQKIQEMREA